jgi:hypothetical protein
MRNLKTERLKSTYEIDAAAVPLSQGPIPAKKIHGGPILAAPLSYAVRVNSWVPHPRDVFVFVARVGDHERNTPGPFNQANPRDKVAALNAIQTSTGLK